MTALLEVRDLEVRYAVGRAGVFSAQQVLKALDRVPFSMQPGETIGLVGESGCGKSTLARAILRLVQPSAGTILWRGEDLLSWPPAKLRHRRRHIQLVFQDPLGSLDPRRTAGESVAEPLRAFEPALSGAARTQRAREMLELVGLAPSMMSRYPHEFSGGQCQRLGIARALVSRPDLLIADEALSALDVSIQAQILNLLAELRDRLDLAMLFISHNLAAIRQISHRIVVLYLGRIVEIGDADSVCERPLHAYTAALIASIPVPDPEAQRQRRRELLPGEATLCADTAERGCCFRNRCPLAVSRCASEAPELRAVAPGRQVACHRV
jgi:oligopeptide transport system ATP-binding protein